MNFLWMLGKEEIGVGGCADSISGLGVDRFMRLKSGRFVGRGGLSFREGDLDMQSKGSAFLFCIGFACMVRSDSSPDVISIIDCEICET